MDCMTHKRLFKRLCPRRIADSKFIRILVLVIAAIPAALWLTESARMPETAAAQNSKLQDPAAAALVRDIENNLIAPCCWTQPISEHFSEITALMRDEVRTFVAEGKSRGEILNYYVGIYGERILAAPPARGINILAYVTPFVALILGACGLFQLREKKRVKIAAATPADTAILTLKESRYNDIISKELRELDD